MDEPQVHYTKSSKYVTKEKNYESSFMRYLKYLKSWRQKVMAIARGWEESYCLVGKHLALQDEKL
jgi:hypothetical protein